ncbi:hypothetical protein BLGT_02765 [Bifidobacterium longum subsp. longum GT15]|nr:hypothetical protein BLGT_02765 [Bifidobacterium longum subsp. longum GT15]
MHQIVHCELIGAPDRKMRTEMAYKIVKYVSVMHFAIDVQSDAQVMRQEY